MKRPLVFGLALVLAAAMGAGIAACSGDEATTTTTVAITTTTGAEVTTTVAATSTTVAGTSTTVVELTTTTTTTTTFPQEAVTIRYATAFAETEASGKVVRYFVDRVEEATAGAVTFDVFFDGVLGNGRQELALVRSGSVDMVSLRFRAFPYQLPLLCLPGWAPGEQQKMVDYRSRLVFEDPETAPLFQAEAKANNVTYVGFVAGGANVFVGREPFTALSDLVDKQSASHEANPAFEALGLAVVEEASSDIREALAGGAIDVTWGDFSETADLGWYEVAPYYVWDGTYGTGYALTVNLDTWGRLSPETKEVLQEAARDAEAFSRDLDADEAETLVGVLEEAGVVFGTLSSEDRVAWSHLLFEAGVLECMTRGVTLGISRDMVTVLSSAASFAGVAWWPELAKRSDEGER